MKKIIIILIALFISFISINLISAVLLDNDVQVNKNSTLTYYLKVNYNGVDVEGIESSNTVVSDVRSGYIYVEDKIPEGLTFEGFVETDDGTIGAYKIKDGTSCQGYVVDGISGLKYDEETKTVSFNVKNLQAGCELTVGIITKTPKTIDNLSTEEYEERRDFYNYATATEGIETVISNVVHAWMGELDVDLYNVEYEYEGNVPDNAPKLPDKTSYSENAVIEVNKDAILEGYKFNGWQTEDVELSNGKFTMPKKDVLLKGSFDKLDTYKVSYSITGVKPDGYILPSTKEYSPKSIVYVDSLKYGDIINGYKFLGWTSKDVTVTSDNDFIMIDKDVNLEGKFEEITYKVSYQFQGNNIPSNSKELLPEDKYYKKGEIIKLESEPQVSGYKFLGWYKEDNFVMPENDIVIYGEWALSKNTFSPTITKEIINKKKSYKKGDIVKFKIVITNTYNRDIYDIYVSENNDKSKFIVDSAYKVESDHIVKIENLEANESVTLYSEYKITDENNEIINEAEIIGALSVDSTLDTEKTYKAKVSFNVDNANLNNPNTQDNVSKYILTLVISLILIILALIVFKKIRKTK